MAAYNNLIVAVDVEGDNWSLVHIPKPPYYADDINGIFPSQIHRDNCNLQIVLLILMVLNYQSGFLTTWLQENGL